MGDSRQQIERQDVQHRFVGAGQVRPVRPWLGCLHPGVSNQTCKLRIHGLRSIPRKISAMIGCRKVNSSVTWALQRYGSWLGQLLTFLPVLCYSNRSESVKYMVDYITMTPSSTHHEPERLDCTVCPTARGTCDVCTHLERSVLSSRRLTHSWSSKLWDLTDGEKQSQSSIACDEWASRLMFTP